MVIDAQDTAAKRYGKIGRMAVLKERRGTHLGGAVLAALVVFVRLSSKDDKAPAAWRT